MINGDTPIDGHTHETACLNCDTALIGSHCHYCGQAGHVHRTLGAFFHDLLHGVLHFEGKTWRTLPMLAWQPGKLTRDYIDGQRARYVSPIALFLFIVFLTFALFNTLGETVKLNPGTALEAQRAATERSAVLDQQIAAVEQGRATAAKDGLPTRHMDEQLAGLRQASSALRDFAQRRASEPRVSAGRAQTIPFFERMDAALRHAMENPALLVYKLQTNAYKYSWMMILISVPFLWMLIPRRTGYGLYDHTVFVTYSMSFMLVLLAIASLGAYWSMGAAGGLAGTYAAFHMFRQLRGTYALTPKAALWRTGVLFGFAGLTIMLFTTMLVAMVV